jgi:predicted transposase/invertase (TIGR01784 family)
MGETDKAYKLLFGHKEMVASLLRDFVLDAAVADLDLDTLEPWPGEHVSESLRERIDDRIWRLRWKDADWCYVFVILEFQSTPDRWMAARILSYTAQLWLDLVDAHELGASDLLPPVLPIVLYNGSRTWTAPLDVNGLLAPKAARLEKYQPRQRYFLLDEGRTETGDGDGLSAYLLRLEQAESIDGLRQGIKALRERLADKRYDRLRRVFAVFLSRVVLRRTGLLHEDIPELTDLQEVDNMLEESVDRWSDEILRKGILQGRQEGHAKGRQEGLAEGRQEGLAEGRQEGLAEGRLEGLTEGRKVERLGMVSNMVHAGFSVEQISVALGLSMKDTRELLAHIQ